MDYNMYTVLLDKFKSNSINIKTYTPKGVEDKQVLTGLKKLLNRGELLNDIRVMYSFLVGKTFFYDLDRDKISLIPVLPKQGKDLRLESLNRRLFINKALRVVLMVVLVYSLTRLWFLFK